MKFDPQVYRADVTNIPNGSELHQLVYAYNLNHARTIVGMEFFGEVWTGPEPDPPVPGTVFTTQLHQFAFAVHTFTGPRANDAYEIENQLKEAYGQQIAVVVQSIS